VSGGSIRAVPRCPRRAFDGRLPGTAAAYTRRRRRFGGGLELIGLALGGEAGARPAHEAAGASADTLLRVLTAPAPAATAACGPSRPRPI
jgi:hypothetical protein